MTDFVSLVGQGLTCGKNRVVAIAKDPIGETQKSIATTLYIIDFISTFGRFTADTMYGLHYLSTQECQQRIGRYCENIVILGHVIDKSAETVTAKDVSGAVGHILGDIFSAKIISTAATFLRQIDALGKMSQEAKAIAQGIKTAIEDHPAYATAEGIVLKMGNEIKGVSSKLSNPKNKALAKSGGQIMQENGKAFEDFLVKKLGGKGSFKAGGREFDGVVRNIWYEAKSGNYWERLLESEQKLNKFGSRQD